jgi:hypothetical protein
MSLLLSKRATYLMGQARIDSIRQGNNGAIKARDAKLTAICYEHRRQ